MIDRRPRFSVTIPVYNCAHFLGQTIQSILDQNWGEENMEIVVIDDGSNDNPASVIEKLGKGRIKYIRQENKGPCAAFNACVQNASGQLIHLLHGDDYVLPGFYDAVDAAMSNPQIGMYTCRCREIDDNNKEIGLSYLPPPLAAQSIREYDRLIVPRNHIRTPGVVLKSEVYQEVGAYHPELNHTQDWHMWLRAAQWGKVWHETEPRAAYRIHANSDTSQRAATGEYLWETWRCVQLWADGLPNSKRIRVLDIMNHAIVRMAVNDLAASHFSEQRHATIATVLGERLIHLLPSFEKAIQRQTGQDRATRKVVLFGAGEAGRKALLKLDRERDTPIAIIDNNAALHGRTINGLPVIPPESILHLEFDHIYLASAAHPQMGKQLRHLGLDLRNTTPAPPNH